MFSRIAARAPRAFVRYNSSSTSRAARIVEMAGQVEKPSTYSDIHIQWPRADPMLGALEASVPVMWAVCGVLTYTAWNRMEGRKGDEVEKLIIV
jgi:hypothetical protein